MKYIKIKDDGSIRDFIISKTKSCSHLTEDEYNKLVDVVRSKTPVKLDQNTFGERISRDKKAIDLIYRWIFTRVNPFIMRTYHKKIIGATTDPKLHTLNVSHVDEYGNVLNYFTVELQTPLYILHPFYLLKSQDMIRLSNIIEKVIITNSDIEVKRLSLNTVQFNGFEESFEDTVERRFYFPKSPNFIIDDVRVLFKRFRYPHTHYRHIIFSTLPFLSNTKHNRNAIMNHTLEWEDKFEVFNYPHIQYTRAELQKIDSTTYLNISKVEGLINMMVYQKNLTPEIAIKAIQSINEDILLELKKSKLVKKRFKDNPEVLLILKLT